MRIDQTESRLVTQWNFANPDTMGQKKLSVLVRCPYGLCMQELFFWGEKVSEVSITVSSSNVSQCVRQSPEHLSIGPLLETGVGLVGARFVRFNPRHARALWVLRYLPVSLELTCQ